MNFISGHKLKWTKILCGATLLMVAGGCVTTAVWIAANAQPQDYYGRVVDQNEQPVEGATATATLMKIRGFDVAEQRDTYTTQSDREGNFQFTGLHGWKLGVVAKKTGYELGDGPGVYRGPVANEQTRPEARGVFVLWKLKGAEPMVHTHIEAGLKCDGTPRAFDVLSGRRDAGSLVVKLVRNPVNIDRSKPFDWTLGLQLANGGLAEITDVYPNEAPVGGYQAISVTMSATAKAWTPSLVKSYYFYDGKSYGRITINLMANYQPPPTHFEIEAYVNPAGSRNLEFDPAKEISAALRP